MLQEKYSEICKWPTWPETVIDLNMDAPIAVTRKDARDDLAVVSYIASPIEDSGCFSVKFVRRISPSGKVLACDPGGLLSNAPDAVLAYMIDKFDDFVTEVERTLSSVNYCIVGERNKPEPEPKAKDLTH